MARPLVLFALLVVRAAPAFSATLPEYDASFAAPPASSARLQAITNDDRLAAVARVSGTDARYGVPTFVWSPRLAAATTPAQVDFSAKARAELARLAPFYGLTDADVERLTPARLHDTGSGAVIATFVQAVDGIEVFRDELKIALDRGGSLVAASGYVPPASLDRGSPFVLTASTAAARAWEDATGSVGADLGPPVAAEGGYERFALGGVRAKKVLFHLPTELVPAYYVEVVDHAYVVAATDGAILYRHSLIANDAYGYRAWADGSAQHVPWDGPQGSSFSPHPTGIPDFTAPAFIPSSLLTLASGPISTNDPWLPPAATQTAGNNVDAYADLVAPDGFNTGDLRAATNLPGAFDYAYDLNQGPGATPDQTKAAVTQLFYTTNFLHDWFYDSGFNEASGNAQSNNFGRGGLGGDDLRAEADDYANLNNANMLTPADGGHPRMQMFLWQPGPPYQKVEVNSPPALAGKHAAGGAAGFGPQQFDVTAPVLIASSSTFAATGTSAVAIGNGAEWIDVSDLNQDNLPDFATANYLSQNVSIRFADGAGGFAAGTEIPLGTRPYTVEAGDFNHDGFKDLAVANYDVGTVTLLKGAAGGAFVQRFDLPSGASTTSARVVNLDNDLYDDIVSTNFGANSVHVIRSNGTFGAASTLDLPTGAGPNWVEIGDMNGDGRKDLVVANETASTITLLVDNGAGSYFAGINTPVGTTPLTLAIGDVDRDGDLDVLTANFGDDTISVLLNNGFGTFTLANSYAALDGPVTVRLADLNKDGAPDMVLCSDSGYASWRLGDGGGGFGARVDQAVGTSPYGIQVADVTLDGAPDILTADFGSASVTVVAGTANFQAFGCPGFFSSLGGKIALVDRGGPCPIFFNKALAVQAAGAVGVIIVDNVTAATPPSLAGNNGGVTIPVLSLTKADGAAFKAALANGAVIARMVSAPSVRRSGALDNQLVAHEWGHYISNRLIGNANGLTNPMGLAMGEGWGDFHGLLLTARSGDDFHGSYAWTSYAVQSDSLTNNAYYFGLRRVPYSTSFARDPLTFQHVQLGVPLPPGPPYQSGADGTSNNEAHSAGEVWCSMLWECYVSLLDAMPFAQAQAKMKQLLVAGYKLTPNQPTLLEAREALLAAAFADNTANYVRFRMAFARRGAGAAATGPDRASEDFIPVVESYETTDVPGVVASAALDFALVGGNPSSGSLGFAYTLPHAGQATITIYDVAGRVVATPLDQALEAGPHALRWDANVTGGVYFARLSFAGRHAVQRAVILR